MIESAEYEQRILQIKERCIQEGLDAFIVTSGDNLYYLTGKSCMPFERPVITSYSIHYTKLYDVFKIFGTEDARNMALKKGEIDMLGYLGISPLTLESFEGIDGIDIIVTPGLNLQWLNFNLHKDSGISDVAVRKAIMHSLDIDRIIDMSLLGYADPADSLVYKELDWYNDDVV